MNHMRRKRPLLFKRDISLNHTIRSFYSDLISLLCFCPQYALKDIKTPFFILNSAYDVYQTIAEAVGDWYFGRRVTKEIDCISLYSGVKIVQQPRDDPGNTSNTSGRTNVSCGNLRN
ncbi:hypothetical protein HYC85_025565 [Camellia sinensis]|uniref:Pectin acetylesterase n=1 Tax=Camellia sinensis TaxID=4442 RepID=A0A7J7GBD5_CAMSI|nr:hypothetical protein HYC85_025565 [Camellia sinensis]